MSKPDDETTATPADPDGPTPVRMVDETPLNTEQETITALKCSCNASARFIPLYRFNVSGVRPQLMLGPTAPAAIMCANCRQAYKWVGPSAEGARDGGWERDSMLEDLMRYEETEK